MNKIRILLFATLRDYVGSRFIEMEIPPVTTVKTLIDSLVTQYPNLERVRTSMLAAIDHQYASDDQVIPENAEIAFFPPVSGG